jgi:hypothetical protein
MSEMTRGLVKRGRRTLHVVTYRTVWTMGDTLIGSCKKKAHSSRFPHNAGCII